jgi:hypothetical protein
MKEQTKIRMDIITSRYARRVTEAGSVGELVAARHAEFLRGFGRVRAEVLRPAMEAIGGELTRAGHGYRVEDDDAVERLCVGFHLVITAAPSSARKVIRLFTGVDKEGRSEVVAEVEMEGNLMELTRFHQVEEITPDVVEQMFVDAIEHVFACNGG